MYMDIDETWNNQLMTAQTDNGGSLGGNGNNTALVHIKVHLTEAALPKNRSAGQQQSHGNPPFLDHKALLR